MNMLRNLCLTRTGFWIPTIWTPCYISIKEHCIHIWTTILHCRHSLISQTTSQRVLQYISRWRGTKPFPPLCDHFCVFRYISRWGTKLFSLPCDNVHLKFPSSPCCRAIEAERIPRSRFKNVNADSHSEIILVTEEGSPAIVSDDPTARAACESLRFLKFPRNCNKSRTKKEVFLCSYSKY